MSKQENYSKQVSSEIHSLGDLLTFFDEVHEAWLKLTWNSLLTIEGKSDFNTNVERRERINSIFNHYRTMIEVDDYRMRDNSYFEMRQEIRKVAVEFPLSKVPSFTSLYSFFETLKLD